MAQGEQPDLHQRIDYEWGTLDEADLGADPVAGLVSWLAEAQAEAPGSVDFNAFVLCTVDRDGRPSARNMLLRGVDDQGRLQFFTNRLSRKGRALEHESRVCLIFSWLPMHRQVRVEGSVEQLSDAEGDEYFATRPRESQLAAWASDQSEVIGSRAVLDAAMADCTARFEGGDVPRPPHWGGYAVAPSSLEFWQGRPSRLHDRVQFRRGVRSDPWTVERLAP